MEVGDAHVFPGFLTPVLTQLSFQSHRLLFSHTPAEVRGKNTLPLSHAGPLQHIKGQLKLIVQPGSTACADPGGGGPERVRNPPPPPEFWQKCGYQVREWDRFHHTAQHLC